MFKFLHAADVHLDSPLRGLERYEGAPAERIRGATRRALESLVRLALEESVDFVLLAGDLYDGDWRDFNTGLFLVKQMARLKEAGIPVFVLAGNHDAANRMTRSLKMPDNVRYFDTKKPETAVLENLGAAIHGQGFREREVFDDLSQKYPAAIAGIFNIGLLHTCATSTAQERYAPCTIEGLCRKEYDYWALGHIHKRQELSVDPPIVFPGNLQGRHIGEEGPKGCILVTVKDGKAATREFRGLAQVRWQRCVVQAEAADRPDCILDKVESALRRMLDDAEPELFAVRVEVTGNCRGHGTLQARDQHYLSQLRARSLELDSDRLWLEKIEFKTTPESSHRPATFEGPYEFAALLEELRTDAAKMEEIVGTLADLKRKLPVDLTQGEDPIDPTDPEWLRHLLGQVEPMLMRQLLPEGGDE